MSWLMVDLFCRVGLTANQPTISMLKRQRFPVRFSSVGKHFSLGSHLGRGRKIYSGNHPCQKRVRSQADQLNLNTKSTHIHQHIPSIRSVPLISHCVIAKTFSISSRVRDYLKLVDCKRRAQWGRVARASIVGRIGGSKQQQKQNKRGEGSISGVFLHVRVLHSPIQLVGGRHGLHKNLVDRMKWRRRGEGARSMAAASILSRSLQRACESTAKDSPSI